MEVISVVWLQRLRALSLESHPKRTLSSGLSAFGIMERLIEKLFSECVKRELEDDDLKIMREQKVLLLAGENSSLDLNIPAHYIVKKVSEEFFSENAPGSTTCKTCGHGHGHGRSEDMPTSGGKEEEDVAAEPQSCSICVDLLVHGGERSITKLPCQHEFHFGMSTN